MNNKKVITISLPSDKHDQLQSSAKKQSRSMSSIVREGLYAYLDDRERPVDLAELLKSQRTGEVEA